MASNSLWVHSLAYFFSLRKPSCLSKKCISCPHTSRIELLPTIIAKQHSTSRNQPFVSAANEMENNKVSEVSSTTNDNAPDLDSVPSEVRLHMPPKPMGTRPCSPSESDISVYALPPPANHIFSNALPAAPVPKITPKETEIHPAQVISPATASTAIMAPAPAVITSTPAVVQGSSLGAPAQPTPAPTRGRYGHSDVESTTYGRRRRNGLVDNAAVRTMGRAGGWSFWYIWGPTRDMRWQTKVLIFCGINLVVCLSILGSGLSEG